MELTKQDADVLIEAVDAWVSKDMGALLMTDMMDAMLSKEEDKAAMEARRENRNAESNKNRKRREERAIVLKAKLLKLRDSITAETTLAEA